MRYCLMEKENMFLKNPQVKSWTVYPSLGDGYILNRSSADHTANKFGYCCCGDCLAVFRKGIYFSDITRERAAMGKLGRVLLKIFKDTQMAAEHLVSTPFRWSVITCMSIPHSTHHIIAALWLLLRDQWNPIITTVLVSLLLCLYFHVYETYICLVNRTTPDVVSLMKIVCSAFRSAPLLRLNWLSSWKIMIYCLEELTLMSLSILSLLLRSWLLMQRLFPVKAVNAFTPVGCVFPTLFAHETCWSALMSVLQLWLFHIYGHFINLKKCLRGHFESDLSSSTVKF